MNFVYTYRNGLKTVSCPPKQHGGSAKLFVMRGASKSSSSFVTASMHMTDEYEDSGCQNPQLVQQQCNWQFTGLIWC